MTETAVPEPDSSTSGPLPRATKPNWTARGASSARPGKGANEDAFAISSTEGGVLIVVAVDGMGGLGHGDEAAALATAELRRVLLNDAIALNPPWPDCIRGAFEAAHRALSKRAADAGHRLGAAAAVAVIDGDKLWYGHTGDVRIYRVFSSGSAARLTRDMTAWQDVLDQAGGDASPPSATDAESPSRSVESRTLRAYLGRRGDGTFAVPRTPLPLGTSDRIALVSDGVYEHIEDRELGAMTCSRDPQEAAQSLVALATERRTSDDATAVVAYRSASELLRRTSPSRPLDSRHLAAGAPRPPAARRQEPGKTIDGPADPRLGAIALIGVTALVLALAALVWAVLPSSAPSPAGPGTAATAPKAPAEPRTAPAEARGPDDETGPASVGDQDPNAAPSDGAARATANLAVGSTWTPWRALRIQSPASDQIRAIFRGELRRQLKADPAPPLLDPALLPSPLSRIVDPDPLPVDDRAALLNAYLSRLVEREDVPQLKTLEAQLTYREGEPFLRRTFEALQSLNQEPLVQQWARIHGGAGR